MLPRVRAGRDMQGRELLLKSVGIQSTWSVWKVTLNFEHQQVDWFVDHRSGDSVCPLGVVRHWVVSPDFTETVAAI
jgi:hypothetical protein